MKLFVKISIIVVFSTFLAPYLLNKNHKTTEHQGLTALSERTITELSQKEKFDKAYEESIAYIKVHEGFNGGKIYFGPAGIKSVGHGHVIYPKDTFTQAISLKTADLLVREDFNTALKSAEEETGFTGYKKIAVAHFIFCFGKGNFRKSRLKKKMLANQAVAKEFEKWCNYRTPSGQVVRSKHLYRIRKWEIEMYNRGYLK